jgi:hypothetical protein
MAEIKDRFLIVAFDGKNFLENGLQTDVLALARRDVFLQKIDVGIELNLDQVWRLDGFFDCAEMDTFCCGTI